MTTLTWLELTFYVFVVLVVGLALFGMVMPVLARVMGVR